MIKEIKQQVKELVEKYVSDTYGINVSVVVEQPKNLGLGDISLPIFNIVKLVKKPLPELASEIKDVIFSMSDVFESINITGGFINIKFEKDLLCYQILRQITDKPNDAGINTFGNDKTVVMDYSSPNIAKSFSIGHLRSTMIGNSLKLIYKKCGYNVVGINYLGDWGTQFGKMIVAYQKWGNREEINKDPINTLTNLYVRFHDEASHNPELEDEARAAFKRLEDGDTTYYELWKWIREESLKESEAIYKLLNVSFDSYNGEAYYNDKMEPVVKELDDKGLLETDQGAKIVRLGDDIVPALIKRSDGGSLYITRDLAAIFDRKARYNFKKILYVVGNEQKLHFEQLKRIIKLMGYDFSDMITHINFGLVLKDGKKMSTRSGNVEKLQDVLDQAILMAKRQILEKNPNLEDADEVARKVGCGAVVFNDLKNHRSLDYEFDTEHMLKFEGQTGPYLQYTSVRIFSILRGKSFDSKKVDLQLFDNDLYFELARSIDDFSSIIEKSCLEDSPSIIAKYLLSLAQTFNKFYGAIKINDDDELVRNTNFMISYATQIVINEGLRLLGIEYVDVM